jgi:hypothetical protein
MEVSVIGYDEEARRRRRDGRNGTVISPCSGNGPYSTAQLVLSICRTKCVQPAEDECRARCLMSR